MRTRRHWALWFVPIALTLAGVAGAGERGSPRYLPSGAVEARALLPPPPAVGSADLATQMAIVLWLQRTRTPEQIAFAREPLNLGRFAPLLGDALLAVDGRALAALLDDVIDEVRADYDRAKGAFDLPRPGEVNPEVESVVETRPVAAYPSGHAIRATVYARLLGEVFPARRDALAELGRQIGYGRVVAGVHYPIDVVAGQRLGRAYAEAIAQQTAFRDALRRIRGEPPRGGPARPR